MKAITLMDFIFEKKNNNNSNPKLTTPNYNQYQKKQNKPVAPLKTF